MDAILFLGSVLLHKLLAGAQKKHSKGGRERKKVNSESWAGSLWAAVSSTPALGYFKTKTQREHRVRTSALACAWNLLSKEEKVTLVNLVRQSKIRQAEKLNWALSNGIDVCVDLSYETQQTIGELRSLARQLSNTYAMMKRSPNPCHLHITSIGSQVHAKTAKSIDTERVGLMTEVILDYFYNLFRTITRRSSADKKQQKEKSKGNNEDTMLFLDRMGFSNWKVSKHAEGPSVVANGRAIVYLSPDAPEALTHFDPACVYVVGGIVDCTVRSGLTKNRARSVGAVCRRLPIQEYIPDHGNHILNVDCCVHIVCSHIETGDWAETFKRTLPQRKLIKGGKAERYRRNKDRGVENSTGYEGADGGGGGNGGGGGGGGGDEDEDEVGGIGIGDDSESLGGSLEARAANSRWIRWIEREVGLEYGTKDREKASAFS